MRNGKRERVLNVTQDMVHVAVPGLHTEGGGALGFPPSSLSFPPPPELGQSPT